MCRGEPDLTLVRGESAFIAADADYYELSSAVETVVFRASVPEIS